MRRTIVAALAAATALALAPVAHAAPTPRLLAGGAPLDGTTLTGLVDVDLTLQGRADVTFTLDGDTVDQASPAPYDVDVDAGALADGTHELAAVIDPPGRRTPYTVAASFTVDNVPDAPALAAPTGVWTTTALPGDDPYVYWGAVEGATGYRVYVRNTSTGQLPTPIRETWNYVTIAGDYDQGAGFEFAVSALAEGTESPLSEWVTY